MNRREFLSVGAASMATLAIGAAPTKKPGAGRPIVVASPNGMSAVEKVMEKIRAGADPLDAAIDGVAIVEADPNDHSVGFGGVPNEDGVVEMDAAVMHGPTHGAGAVAALRHIMHPAAVARVVMRRTQNCLLVGEGALKFAREHDFPEVDLLTEETKTIWLAWKEAAHQASRRVPLPESELRPIMEGFAKLSWRGSMACAALDTHGDLGGMTVAPGSPFKIPGRVGDFSIPGAGLYVDNEVGACFSTGTGELNLLNCSSYQVVDNLRRGMDPKDACLEACKRIVQTSAKNPHFRADEGRLNSGVVLYCLTKDGKFGGASMGRPASMVVHDGEKAQLVELAEFPL